MTCKECGKAVDPFIHKVRHGYCTACHEAIPAKRQALLVAAPAALSCCQDLIDAMGEEDDEISGADLIDWLSWYLIPRCKAAVAAAKVKTP
jgi:hypothetical protein